MGPCVVFVSNFSRATVAFVVVLIKLKVILKGVLDNEVSKHCSPLHVTTIASFVVMLTLLVLFFYNNVGAASLVFTFVYYTKLFTLSTPLRVLLLRGTGNKRLLNTTNKRVTFGLNDTINTCYNNVVLALKLTCGCITLPTTLLSFTTVSSLLLCNHCGHRRTTSAPILTGPLK